MDKKTIIANNILIALFLGLKDGWWLASVPKETEKQFCDHGATTFLGGSVYKADQMKFHKEWNWLMPILNKIAITGQCYYELHSKYTQIQANFYDSKKDRMRCYKTIYYTGSDNLQNTYNAVVEFIKVYNKYTAAKNK